ncbi:MAG: hypothetical protein FWE67_02575 [Planctomycetaceae bacterium]|nr:hypothetical protein [Planctomycetaceae bacterium]
MKTGLKFLLLFAVLSPHLFAHDATIFGPVIPYETVKDSNGCTAIGGNGKRLFTVGNGTLSVYDIASNPAQPRLVSRLSSLIGGRQLAISGNTLRCFVPMKRNRCFHSAKILWCFPAAAMGPF